MTLLTAPTAAALNARLSLPVIGSPLFIISNPDLVIAQCRAGIVGAFPSLNARPLAQLDEWLARLSEELGPEDAPWAVNLIVHKSTTRLMDDLALVVKYKAPIVITSLGRARGRQRGRAQLWRHGAARYHQQPVCAQSDR